MSHLQEEMDIKVLQFQNKKLVERIEQRRKAEEQLKQRIEQLEQRQTTDDAVLCIVNRYWNQASLLCLQNVQLFGGVGWVRPLMCGLPTDPSREAFGRPPSACLSGSVGNPHEWSNPTDPLQTIVHFYSVTSTFFVTF